MALLYAPSRCWCILCLPASRRGFIKRVLCVWQTGMNSRLADVLLVPRLRAAYIKHLEAELGMENLYFIDAVQVGPHTHTHRVCRDGGG